MLLTLLSKRVLPFLVAVLLFGWLSMAVAHGAVPKNLAAPQPGTGSANAAAAVASPDPFSGCPAPQGDGAGSTTGPANVAHSNGDSNDPVSLKQQIAKLPPLHGTNINVAATEKDGLAHLNATLTYYRLAISPMQKVGDPSDVLYRDQFASQALQAAQLAFMAAKNSAGLLVKIAEQPEASAPSPNASAKPASTDAQRLDAAAARARGQLAQMQQQSASLRERAAHTSAREAQAFRLEQERLDGGIELQQATVEALNRFESFSEPQRQSGLIEDINLLERSAPEIAAKTCKPAASAPVLSASAARDSGVLNQATVLFELLATRQAIDKLIRQDDVLRSQAIKLRDPVLRILRSTLHQGETLFQQSVNSPAGTGAQPTVPAPQASSTREQFDQLTATFQVLAQAALPLSQEVVLLESQRTTLTTWRTAVDEEYRLILHGLLLRVLGIAFALILLTVLNSVWARATARYVHDLRRRRQLTLVRRVITGFIGCLIATFGFVTQFSSIATFAGFITAGVAVGLQTILLSIAAFFFIVGRYGVKVGDRLTVAGVTGDVVEIGLVRFYMMELAGSGTELHPTGRVAVFANSVLFQTGTPLYKQMPGTEYVWHELTAKLKTNANAQTAMRSVLRAINEVYETYRARLDQQHRDVEQWMGAAIESPKVSPRLQLMDSGLQLAVLFPVEVNSAAETDQRIAEALLLELEGDGPLHDAIDGTPVIKATIK